MPRRELFFKLVCSHFLFLKKMQSRFGANWRDHLPAKYDVVSIKELIDHTIDEGNRLFADTRFD